MNQTIKKRIEDINNGIVPEGYKQTPFGIFPCDWEATSIGEVSINKGEYGLNAPACEYEVGLPKYIRITDIDDNGNYVNTGACVNFQDETTQYTLKDRDIVFARTGATVGRNYLYKEKDGELLYAGFLIKFSIDKKVAHPYIVYANCNTKQYWDWIKKISARSGQPGVNAEEYSQYRFVKAKDKTEQSKIAEILMKWDEMVELQEQYIQKLELRKKAIMKKLLTPKDGWKDVKLGAIAEMYAGGTPSTKNTEYWGGDIPWIQSGLIQNNYIEMKDIDGRITEKGLKNSSTSWIEKDSVLVAITGATCANIGYLKCNATANQSVISITTNKINPLFLYFYMQNARNELLALQNGSAQGGLTLKYLQNFEIQYPDNELQQSISKILYVADEEISLQKEKLDRIKIQRKAMHQYLLTGIVRVG